MKVRMLIEVDVDVAEGEQNWYMDNVLLRKHGIEVFSYELDGYIGEVAVLDCHVVQEFTCKYCGAPSEIDPSDQTPPPDYCHPEDHRSIY